MAAQTEQTFQVKTDFSWTGDAQNSLDAKAKGIAAVKEKIAGVQINEDAIAVYYTFDLTGEEWHRLEYCVDMDIVFFLTCEPKRMNKAIYDLLVSIESREAEDNYGGTGLFVNGVNVYDSGAEDE